jgi:cell division protein FtsB
MTTENTTEQEEPSVSINGVQKPIAELNATQKYYVAQIQDLESQEKQHNAKLHQMKVAKEAFVNMLVEDFEKPEEPEFEPVEEE